MRVLGLAALLPFALAACDPAWGARVTLRDPADHPIENATLAVACSDGEAFQGSTMSVRTKRDGTAAVAQIGGRFPPGCDVFVAKPGYRTHHIPYRALCPDGSQHCDRMFSFDLVLEPE